MNFKTIAAGTIAAAILVPTTANAEIRTFKDAKNDVAHGVDIRKVTVTNEKKVKVDIQHKNLVKNLNFSASGSIFLDTDADNPGPEFVLGGGLSDGTDYQLTRTEGFKSVGEPLECKHSLKLDYAADVSHLVFGRKCLDNPTEVRVAVKVTGDKFGKVVTDWLGSKREFTEWVAQG